jgi:hypothetical protein
MSPTRILRVAGLIAAAALTACASRAPTTLELPPTVEVSGVQPIGTPLLAAVVLADERPLELAGSELTAEAREEFNKRRAARVSTPEYQSPSPLEIPKGCVMAALSMPVVGLALCPVMPVMWLGMHVGVAAANHVKGSMREPSLQVPESQYARIAATIQSTLTTASLVERATTLLARPAGRSERPRISLRIKSASIERWKSSAALVVVAEAQAMHADGAALPSTEHRGAFGPLTRWDASDEELKHAVERTLDALARHIVDTYSPEPKRVHAKSDEQDDVAARGDDPVPLPDVQAFLAALSVRSAVRKPGATWTYRLTEPRGAVPAVHRVAVERVSAAAVWEATAREPHRAGAYQVRERDLVLFSPYLGAFQPDVESIALGTVHRFDPETCNVSWFCAATAEVAARETVRVPAGEFEAVKVIVRESWSPRGMANAWPSGARTLTVWYADGVQRAVKFSSRGSRGAHIKTDFDLELQSYEAD